MKLSLAALLLSCTFVFAQEKVEINFAHRQTMIDQLVDMPECVDHLEDVFPQILNGYSQIILDYKRIEEKLYRHIQKISPEICNSEPLDNLGNIIDEVQAHVTDLIHKYNGLVTYSENLNHAVLIIDQHLVDTVSDDFYSEYDQFLQNHADRLYEDSQLETIPRKQLAELILGYAIKETDKSYVQFVYDYLKANKVMEEVLQAYEKSNNAYSHIHQELVKATHTIETCIDTFNSRID